MKRLKDFFISLYRDKHQVILLTWLYSAIALIFVVIAAFVYLANQPVGAALLIVPLVFVTALCANVVCWTILNLIFAPFAKKAKKKSTKKKPAKKNAKKSKKKH
ncbi:hypothetical protein IK110_03395 [Candidatus Saccharibacteria bacterium]|nr:hypothetical protein [Candidatus Saccharibacteria bacterium]